MLMYCSRALKPILGDKNPQYNLSIQSQGGIAKKENRTTFTAMVDGFFAKQSCCGYLDKKIFIETPQVRLNTLSQLLYAYI